MELNTRLINEGFFVFWNDENNNDSFLMKLYFCHGDEKIFLMQKQLNDSNHCYSLDKLGSGEYIVEVNAYKDSRLVETVEKNVHISSSIQLLTELKDLLNDINTSVNRIPLLSINIDAIYSAITDPAFYMKDDSWASFATSVNKKKNRNF